MAGATVTGEVLGTPNAEMRDKIAEGGPRLFTPWVAMQDEPAAAE